MTDFEFLGPYRVEAKLGQGGMGTVYRGVHTTTGQRVAVKVLASQMSREARFRRRFDAEIETLKKLRHPNIVRLIGFGEEQGLLFYSMELVEGPSLLEHLRKVKRLDWDTTLGFAIEICAALKHAHDLGVIHRDLKPANLLLEPEGGIKLTDFGIAKLFGATEQTAAGAVLGTADYMAPEQASGGPTSPRTDLYALGSLMYACLVGRPPFGGRNLTQVIHGLNHETPAPINLILPDLPPELAELIHELLEKSPEDRPPTALTVGKRLRALRAGLRRRGNLTRHDFQAPTVPERVPKPDGPPSQPYSVGPSLANEPTAAESDSHNRTGAAAGLAPTVASQTIAPPEPSSQIDTADRHIPAPRTHFEAVPHDVSSHHWTDPPEAPRDLRHWASILALSVMLVVAVGIVLWMLRSPSADDLMADLRTAELRDDRYAYEAAAEDFLRLYPDDPRTPQVRDSLEADDVDQMSRSLRARAALAGGVEYLDPADQAWLEAVDHRHRHPGRSAENLVKWLAVFGHPSSTGGSGPGNEHVRRLARLARTEIERLRSAPTTPDPRAERLEQWIDWGLDNLQGGEREEFIRGVKALYADKPWAETLLMRLTD